ncbi:MAG: sugar-binding domain-containing protein [Phycicoccus sp.]
MAEVTVPTTTAEPATVGRRAVLAGLAASGLGATVLAGGEIVLTGAPAGADDAELLPRVRLTPPVTSVVGVAQSAVDLAGTWQFLHAVPDDLAGDPAGLSGWGPVEIPGQFAFQGYPRMHRVIGTRVAYRHEFAVPADWAGQRVRLRLDCVNGLGRYWCNGTPVGTTESAFVPDELDVTAAIRPGETNVLSMTVEVSELTTWARREMGAIARPVGVQALPPVNLARLHAQCRVLERGDVDLTLLLAVENATAEDADALDVELELRRIDGRSVSIGRERVSRLGAVAAGTTLDQEVTVRLRRPDLWWPESPELHVIRVTLRDRGTRLMQAERQIGLREVRIDGDRVLLNGTALKLRAVNGTITRPGYDHFPPAEAVREDLDLFAAANLDYTRPWPTPGRDYVDHCNRIGMLTQVASQTALMIYDKGYFGDSGNTDRFADQYVRQVALMVEAYRSDPAVLSWSLGNECYWYPYFERAAKLLAATDPGRLTVFSSDLRIGIGKPYLNTNDDHYPRNGWIDLSEPGKITGGDWDIFPTDRPIQFSEWCHVNMYNIPEQEYDPGIFDDWGWQAQWHQEHVWRNREVLAGHIFIGSPITTLRETTEVGFFDIWRRSNASYWHVQMASSPIQVDPSAVRTSARGRLLEVPVRNLHTAVDLRDVEFRWSAGRASGRTRAPGAPGSTAVLRVPRPEGTGPVLLEALVEGRVLARWTLEPDAVVPPPPAAVGGSAALVLQQDAGRTTVRGERFELVFDETVGRLVTATVDGTTVLVGGPRLHWSRVGSNAVGRNVPVVDQLVNWVQASWTAEPVDGSVRLVSAGRYGTAAASAADVTVTTTVRPDGSFDVGYQASWGGADFNVFQNGIAVVTPRELDRLSWRRRPQWTWYPEDHIGRPVGSALRDGDPEWADERAAHDPATAPPWPWSQDVVQGAVRDFRSTKANIHSAVLRGSGGSPGVAVLSDGEQHVHVIPEGDRHRLLVSDYWSGGTDGHTMKSARLRQWDTMTRKQASGTVRLRLLAGE